LFTGSALNLSVEVVVEAGLARTEEMFGRDVLNLVVVVGLFYLRIFMIIYLLKCILRYLRYQTISFSDQN
jgi:hypothetical protein